MGAEGVVEDFMNGGCDDRDQMGGDGMDKADLEYGPEDDEERSEIG